MQPTEPLAQILEIPLTDIEISDDNVRLHNAERDLDQLAESIHLLGLMQPVVLTGEFGKPPYQLISGQRRFMAHERILKAPTIRAVFAGNLSRTESLIRSLVENMQRTEPDYNDTSVAISRLVEVLGSDKAVSKATGLSLQRVRAHQMIETRASPKMKELLGSKKVSPTDVKRVLQAAQDDIAKAEKLLDLIIEQNPTAHQKRRLIGYGASKPKASAEELFEDALAPHVEQKLVISLSESIRSALGSATKSMEMDAPDLAEKILSEWLLNQGFLK